MTRMTVDRDVLPVALLALAKSQMRVEHNRDDVLITEQLRAAIVGVERRCSININPAQFAFEGCDITATGRLPVNNVSAIVSLFSGGVDVSSNYGIKQDEMGGNAHAYLVGPTLNSNDAVLVVDVGMQTVDAIDPAITAAVLRITAAYYENRETFAPVFVDDFLGELIAIWRPAV